MEKQTFVQKVLALLTGGDEAKLSRFEGKLSKYFTKQIAMRKESIENLEEKIVDAKEAVNDAVLNVNLEKINSTESSEGYCPSYVANVVAKQEIIEGFEQEIVDLKAEIVKLEKAQTAIYANSTTETK